MKITEVTIDTPGPEPVTDHLARLVWAAKDKSEPLPGSVALTGGEHGTAWQRQFHDGLWHSTRRKGGPKTWEWLLGRRNLMLAYDAEPRTPTAQPEALTAGDLEDAL